MGRAGTFTRIQAALTTCGGVRSLWSTRVLWGSISQLGTRGVRTWGTRALSITGVGCARVSSDRGGDQVRVSEAGVGLLLYGELLPIQQGELDLLGGGDWHQVGFLGAGVLEIMHPVAIRILARHPVLCIGSSTRGVLIPQHRGGHGGTRYWGAGVGPHGAGGVDHPSTWAGHGEGGGRGVRVGTHTLARVATTPSRIGRWWAWHSSTSWTRSHHASGTHWTSRAHVTHWSSGTHRSTRSKPHSSHGSTWSHRSSWSHWPPWSHGPSRTHQHSAHSTIFLGLFIVKCLLHLLPF